MCVKFNSFFVTGWSSENLNVDPAEDVAPASNREPVEQDTLLASVKQPQIGQEGKEWSSGSLF